MACKSLDDFHAFIKGEGLDLDEEEAQAIFEEMYEIELSDEELEALSGGIVWSCEGQYECTTFEPRRRHRKK